MQLQFRGLTKTYPGGRTALSGVDLTVSQGLYGLLGPNGAGKTTLMKIACTLLAPTSGQVLVDGQDLAADRDLVRARLGYLGQEWGAPPGSRCGEVIDLVLRLRGVDGAAKRSAEVDRLLGLVGLQDHRKRKVKTLSGGMVRRLGVAQALAGDPALIVMDEPTVGLDPDERVAFRNLLAFLGRERTIVLSTHIVADVGNTCERVAILDGGRVLFEGSPSDFAARARGRVFQVPADAAREQALRESMIVVSSLPTREGSVLRVVGEPSGAGFEAVEPTLEDAYLLVVGAAAEQVQ